MRNVILTIVFFALGFLVVKKMMNPSKQSLVDSAVRVMKRDVPRTIDEYTNWIGVEAGKEEIIYTYEIFGLDDDVVISKKNEHKNMIAANLKSMETTNKLLNRGIKFSYIYKNESGKELIRFTIG